jgi:uncharacterized damage-inducible protein DinB
MGLSQSTSKAEVCRDLFRFHQWRQAKVCELLGSVDTALFSQQLPGSFGSLYIIVHHLVWAEMVWLGRVDHNTVAVMQDHDIQDMLAVWQRSTSKWSQILETSSEEDFNKILSYYNTKGDAYQNSLAEIVFHVVDHATYHIGQLMTALRGFGIEPVPTNIIHYLRATA